MSVSQQLQRIGLIGDIHAEDKLLRSALKFISSARVDLIMAVGDITDGPGSVDHCCLLLEKYKVEVVAGNHERWYLGGEARDLPDATASDQISLKTQLYLRGLPRTRSYETVAGRLLLCHGLGEYDMAGVWPGDYGYALESNMALLRLMMAKEYRYVANGHTHHRLVRSFDDLTIINAGTLFHEHYPCFVIVDFKCGEAQYYDITQDGRVSEGELYRLFAQADGRA